MAREGEMGVTRLVLTLTLTLLAASPPSIAQSLGDLLNSLKRATPRQTNPQESPQGSTSSTTGSSNTKGNLESSPRWKYWEYFISSPTACRSRTPECESPVSGASRGISSGSTSGPPLVRFSRSEQSIVDAEKSECDARLRSRCEEEHAQWQRAQAEKEQRQQDLAEAKQAREQEKKAQQQAARSARYAEIKAGKTAPASCAEHGEALGATALSGPLLEPSQGLVLILGAIEDYESGVLTLRAQKYFVRGTTSQKTIWFGKDKLRIGGNIGVIGKYVKNDRVALVSGATAPLVVLDVTCVEDALRILF